MKLLHLRCLASLAVSFLFSAASFSQTPPGPADAPGDGRVAEWMYGEHIPPIASLPFTAKAELETQNQLPDGTLISHRTYNLIARDSAGRTHNEARVWIDPTSGNEPQLTRVELYDPASRTRTFLFPLTKLARQWSPAPAAPLSRSTPAGNPETSRENIGVDSIEGIPVHGTRVSQLYKAGSLGNDRPLTIVTEYWYSEELKINLLTKRTDPRFGVQTVRVTQLLRQEPEESMFVISADYKVVQETGAPLQAGVGAVSGGFASTPVSLPNGVLRAGVGGTGVPVCVYCPNPSYTDKARAAKLTGTVVLRIVVTAEGNAENIVVVKGPGLGLEEQAIEAVKTWRFRPANGPDGQPAATLVPIDVTFRIK